LRHKFSNMDELPTSHRQFRQRAYALASTNARRLPTLNERDFGDGGPNGTVGRGPRRSNRAIFIYCSLIEKNRAPEIRIN
jgi:hypothetical protein